MTSQLRHTIVLLISDDNDREVELSVALADRGCIAHQAEPDVSLSGGHRYDAALFCARPNTSWSADLAFALRSREFACASLIVLATGGPDAVADSLRSGAVDCLVRPVSVPELLESLAVVVDCTKRWRARFSLAQTRVAELPPCPNVAVESPLARVFEPVEQAPQVSGDVRIERVVESVAEQRRLTPRERQVLYWMLLGHRYIDIAGVLGVGLRTTKFHAANVLQKLEIDSRHDLSRLLADEISDRPR